MTSSTKPKTPQTCCVCWKDEIVTDRERGQSEGRRKDESDEQKTAAVETEADLDALDDLLDEIDEVLEENAEEFVKNYVQKGGQ